MSTIDMLDQHPATPGLTTMQSKLYWHLKTEQDQGRTPSFQEMTDAIGLNSKSGIYRLLEALVQRGFVERIRGRARAIRVLDQPLPFGTLARFDSAELINELRKRGLRGQGAVMSYPRSVPGAKPGMVLSDMQDRDKAERDCRDLLCLMLIAGQHRWSDSEAMVLADRLGITQGVKAGIRI